MRGTGHTSCHEIASLTNAAAFEDEVFTASFTTDPGQKSGSELYSNDEAQYRLYEVLLHRCKPLCIGAWVHAISEYVT